jgi:hypothetical protein
MLDELRRWQTCSLTHRKHPHGAGAPVLNQVVVDADLDVAGVGVVPVADGVGDCFSDGFGRVLGDDLALGTARNADRLARVPRDEGEAVVLTQAS